MVQTPAEPLFFDTPAALRAWFERHHADAREQWIGFYKKDSGRPSITWPEAVDEALCVGWIDGVRKRVDDESYMIRFTPRRPSSTWSTVNIERVKALTREGRMRPEGLRAFEKRAPAKSGIYAYEQRGNARLEADAEARFRANVKAWAYFQAQPAWYRKLTIWRIVTAKRADTRERRLAELIECSAQGRTIPGFIRPARRERAP